MSEYREVPEDRIKTVSSVVAFRAGDPEEMIRTQAMRQIGQEIASKLFEFGKVNRSEGERGVITMSVSFDVIVPPSSEKESGE